MKVKHDTQFSMHSYHFHRVLFTYNYGKVLRNQDLKCGFHCSEKFTFSYHSTFHLSSSSTVK